MEPTFTCRVTLKSGTVALYALSWDYGLSLATFLHDVEFERNKKTAFYDTKVMEILDKEGNSITKVVLSL